MGIATGLGNLEGDDEFLFLTNANDSAWLRPYIGGGCRLVEVSATFGKTRRRQAYERMRSVSPRLAALGRCSAIGLNRLSVPIPNSDGRLESLGVDVVHFATQQAFRTDVPSLYQPHDLQHVHHPEYFSPLQVRYRDAAYRAFCDQARIVSVMTDWGRDDLASAFGLPRNKVAVVPWAPVVGAHDPAETRPARGGGPDVPERFLLYPAQTWKHKNHIRLIEAIALLRDDGLLVNLVCTGHLTEEFKTIKKRVDDLRLSDLVRFLGYVDDEDLAELFQRATAMAFPSQFEGWGLPVVEAFAVGLPVAASSATVLPEVAGGAALLFDPLDTRDIAKAIGRIWNDEQLRSSLRDRGLVRASDFSWDRTARIFRALYRRVAERALSDEDRDLLAPPTLVS